MEIKETHFPSSVMLCDFFFLDLSSLPVKRRGLLCKAMFKDILTLKTSPEVYNRI